MNKEDENEINQPDTVILNISETEMIRLDIICRLCANQSERIIGIFSEEGITHELAIKMNMYLPLKVAEGDTLPLQCCWSCASTVLAWHELVIGSVEADRKLRELQVIASKEIVETVEEEQLKIQTSEFEKQKKEESEDDWITDETEFIVIEERVCSKTENNEDPRQGGERKRRADKVAIVIEEGVCTETDKNGCHSCCESDGKKRHADKFAKKNSQNLSKNRRRKSDITYQIFCGICKKGYTRRSDMERHRKIKHPKEFRNEERRSGLETSANTTSEQGNLTCRFCDQNFERRIELKIHVKAEHGVSRLRRKHSEITAEHFCDVCEKGFTRKHDMIKHRKIQHPNVANVVGEDEKNEKRMYLKKLKVIGPDNRSYYRCDVCKKIFRYAYNLLRHQTTHTKAYGFVCHICAKRFPSSGGLRRHLNEHHYGVKKFSCEICGKTFAANATREEHMNIHTNNRPFVCDICGKAFKQKSSLRSHKLFHTNDFKFSCNFCDKKFRRAYELKTHTWTHTGHRPHKCSLCTSTFRLGQDLKRHLKVHEKLSECSCDVCGATFSQQKYLNNHKRSHKTHSKTNSDVASATDFTDDSTVKVFTILTS